MKSILYLDMVKEILNESEFFEFEKCYNNPVKKSIKILNHRWYKNNKFDLHNIIYSTISNERDLSEPDFSYVIHTINPVNKNEDEIYIELAIGLGETLAQSNQKGAPYRLIYNRKNDNINILNLSSYNYDNKNKVWQDIEGNYVKIGNEMDNYFIVQTRPEIV